MNFSKIFYSVIKILGVIIGIVAVYLFFVIALPYIEIPAEKVQEPRSVPIYIYTNGVHTDLVVPLKNSQKDWSQEIRFENTVSKRQDFNFVGIGWGDKGFYLDTPTWSDLKFSTAFKAAFWLGESAMHCTFYKTMEEGADCRKIMITPNQYARLIDFIDSKFDRDASGNPVLIKTKAVYGEQDAFYDAKGKYSFLETCNTWTNNGLKSAGQKAALWTATDKGIFLHYK